MRDFVLLYINGQRIEVRGNSAFLMLSDFLRYEIHKTGTKIVCAEGDCGACTVMCSTLTPGQAKPNAFVTLNSCIMPVALLDGCHVLTVEALRQEDGTLSPLQQAMVNCQGAQCGFCTPGIMMALAQHYENRKNVTEKSVKNCLTGNLCRCTGYQPILQATQALPKDHNEGLIQRYSSKKIDHDRSRVFKKAVQIEASEKHFYSPVTLKEAVSFRNKNPTAKIFSSATDLGVAANKGFFNLETLLGLRQIGSLYKLERSKGMVWIGARVNLAELEKFMECLIPEFSQFLHVFASPQIKNVATLIGNVANGSPIGDTLPFLMVMGATVRVIGSKGSRDIPFDELYKGYRQLSLKPNEIIEGLSFPVPSKTEKIRLLKVCQRKDLDISTVNAGFRVQFSEGRAQKAKVAFGGVAATVLSLPKVEKYLEGKILSAEVIDQACTMIGEAIQPRTDVRGADKYRRKLAQNLFRKFAFELGDVNERP